MKNMLYLIIYYALVVVSFVVFFDTSLKGHMVSHEKHTNFDRLYPITHFNRLEIFCKDLWSDLELLSINENMRTQMLRNPDYLCDQFTLLHKKLEALINNQEEAGSFLIEDINYVAYMIDIIENKFRSLGLVEQDPKAFLPIGALIESSRKYILLLYGMNKEIYMHNNIF